MLPGLCLLVVPDAGGGGDDDECDRALSYTHLDHLHLVSDAGWIVLVRSTSLVLAVPRFL